MIVYKTFILDIVFSFFDEDFSLKPFSELKRGES